MPKFSGSKSKGATNKVRTPTKTVSQDAPDTLTHEGGVGFKKDDKTALYSLAVTNMVSEKKFYEDGKKRDKRFIDLIRKVAVDDPDWIARFIPYLRDTMNMRSAAVVMAVESVRALLGTEQKKVNLRQIVDSAIVRADEPAEMLAYYAAEYGKSFPLPVKRGVADAVQRVYNERSALKYDGLSRDWRMGDVIELTHPTPQGNWQSDLFKYLLDRRHSREWPEEGYTTLEMIEKTRAIDLIPVDQRRAKLLAGEIDFAGTGFTWERVSGWINGPMDAPVWEAIIPQMGYMALLRNLRNFEQAGISKETVEYVRNKLSDPEQVAKSRQFPYRFLSAYFATNSMLWNESLETALDLSTQNIPEFSGETLVLVDVSGSMQGPVSANSKVLSYQIGALLGAAVAARSKGVTLVPYATSWEKVYVAPATSILKLTERLDGIARSGKLSHGTNTWQAVHDTYEKGKHNRIIIISDMQSFAGSSDKGIDVPIFGFDLGGYAQTHMAVGKKNRYEFAGFNDQAFKAIKMLEDTGATGWPF